MEANEPLHLRLLIRGQHHQVQILLVDNLDSIRYLGVDIEVNELRLLVVVGMGLAQRPLNFKPVLECDMVKNLEN